MNPLTNIKNVQKLNERELELGITGKKSWHDEYRDSAWLFIGGMPYDLSEGDIICVFSQYGEVVNFNLVRDRKTGKSKGFSFLCYEDQRSTVLAVDNLNGIKILGRTIRVDHVQEYKIPKEHKDEDEYFSKLREHGCAPTLESSTEEEEEEDFNVLINESKNLKTDSKSKKKKKKKKKKQTSSSSSDSESERDSKKKKVKEEIDIKKEKLDPGYDKSIDLSHRLKGFDKKGSERNREYKRDKDISRERFDERLAHRKQDYNGRDRSDSRERKRARSKSPKRQRDRSRDRQKRSQSREKDRSKNRERSWSRERGHSKERHRSRERQRYSERERSRERDLHRYQERSRDRRRDR